MDYKEKWTQAMSYDTYVELVDGLLQKGMTTGENHSEEMIGFTELNQHRMKRVTKSFKLMDGVQPNTGKNLGFLIITEAWCGDASQIVPAVVKLGEAIGVESRLVLRDENEDLMNLHLTNGGKAIPIALLLDLDSYEVIAKWGPRPQAAQQLVIDYKKLPEPKEPYSEFVKSIQLWYAKDKTQSIQRELMEAVSMA